MCNPTSGTIRKLSPESIVLEAFLLWRRSCTRQPASTSIYVPLPLTLQKTHKLVAEAATRRFLVFQSFQCESTLQKKCMESCQLYLIHPFFPESELPLMQHKRSQIKVNVLLALPNWQRWCTGSANSDQRFLR